MAYTQVTLATARARLQDRYDATPFWSDEEARLAINEALRIWNALTGFWKDRKTATTTINSPWVTVPGTLLFSTRVDVASYPLVKVSLFELDQARPGWEGQTTASGGSIPTSIKNWAPAGLKRIGIWPVDASGGTTITFDGIAITPILTADGDYIDIGQEELDTILGYALHVISFKRGGAVFAATVPLYDAFIKAAVNKNAQLGASEPFKSFLGADFTRTASPIHNDHRGFKP